MFESLLKGHIQEHLDKHNLINSSQHVFTKGKSCLTNLLKFLEDITLALDKGEPVDAIYLDFSKAFDKVLRQILLVKLRAHGISGHVVNWIENWLSYRKLRVVINGEASMWSDVTSGVPQG